MTVTNLSDRAINIFNKRITNEIFLIIQNNRELMHDYLKLVEKHGLTTVNQNIGKAVEKAYKLQKPDLEYREHQPTCTLIQTHQKFL